MTLEIIVILLLLGLNAFFALAEIAVISSRRTRLKQLADEGNARAGIALALQENPTTFLSSVQVGLTLVSVLAGAFGGATLAGPLAEVFRRLPLLAPYAQTLALVITVIGITYLTLVIGELVPKRLALRSPESWAQRVAPAMRLLARISSPLVRFLGVSSDVMLKLFRLPATPEPPISDEEITLLLEEGMQSGVFERAEKEIVERLFRLSDRRVNALMTPRLDVVWLEADSPEADIFTTIDAHPFTAYPVCERTIDNVIGVVFARSVLVERLEGRPVRLRALLRPPLIFHEGTHALRTIDALKTSGAHLAIVIDEYGATEGIVTLTDIIESLLGEMPSGGEPDVVTRPDGSWLVDGQLPTDELKELLDVDALPGEDEGRYHTLGGLFLDLLGRIPTISDTVRWGDYRFEVVDMDARRIDRILITRVTPPHHQ